MNPSMTIAPISRDPNQYTRSTTLDIHKYFTNTNPSIHPFEKGREYIRALNATKLEKVNQIIIKYIYYIC
jgi:WD repeat and SOF domain-containing protein 1